MARFASVDAADYVEDAEAIAEYITAALNGPDFDVFLTAVRDVARARGTAQLARDAGLDRGSLCKAPTPGANPRYDTLLVPRHALGLKLGVAGPFLSGRQFPAAKFDTAFERRCVKSRAECPAPRLKL